MKHTKEDLKIMQAWSLARKIQVTQTRIIEWYHYFDGQVYVSFSGGKDSTVLLDLARRIYPDIEAVFVDTGLEYPEIREFVKTKENVMWLRPEKTFDKVISEYGYPVISKQNAYYIRQIKYSPETTRNLRLYGTNKNGEKMSPKCKLPEKWKCLINAPFEISEQCCDFMKKKPFKKYSKLTGKKPITGTMAYESEARTGAWLKRGCNAFDKNREISNPMSFWTEQDVLKYLLLAKLPIAKVYGDIELVSQQMNLFDELGELKTTGVHRTGCMFCMFGVHLEKEPNRFQQMKITHPKQYDYCINKLGCGKVLDYIDVKY